jgi:C-terminal peptidase prc
MPDEVLHPPLATNAPTPSLPANTQVSADTTAAQMQTFDALRDTVQQTYVYPDFNGRDWTAITARYEALVQGGLTDHDFYQAMNSMIAELGDNHSYFQSPDEAAKDDAANTQGQNFVGIGILANPIPGTSTGSIIAIFPGSPAEEAGLRPHDALLEVDGQPYRDAGGKARSLGPEGTSFELTYQRPGEDKQTVTITRRAVSGSLPVGYCIVPDTRIGYVLIPTFLDESIDDQVGAALQKMTSDGPLDGLIIDNRENGGGSGQVLEATLSLFTDGDQGTYVTSGGDERGLDITAGDVGGSQTVPLVLLAGPDTISNGEVFTGILQDSGRAKVIGQTTAGNVETLDQTTFDDGSRLWLASESFAPVGLEAGAWEGVGIEPDVTVPARWDLFTEANDPALAQAIELLQ